VVERPTLTDAPRVRVLIPADRASGRPGGITFACGGSAGLNGEASGLDPEVLHGTVSSQLNCGGRGLCATCTVEVDPAPEPVYWHDAAAVRFGYPRLSCCIEVDRPMTVRLLEKHVWGQVLPRRSDFE
jgi:hypothetical protein